jgi:predicted Kef-type K+ transport protein
MHHETALVATIAIGLALAFLFGFAAARLRLPPLVGLALMGERELALGMTRYALRGLGVAADEAEMSVQAMRILPATAHTTPARSEPVG